MSELERYLRDDVAQGNIDYVNTAALAERAGSTPAKVLRVMKKLVAEGLTSTDGRQLMRLDGETCNYRRGAVGTVVHYIWVLM